MTERPSLDELVGEVSPDKLDQPCQDEDLCKIASFITEWQAISPFLGISEAKGREIEYRHTRDLAMQKIAMLRMWRTKYGINATYRRLVEIFWTLELTDLITKVCNIIHPTDTRISSDSSTTDQPAFNTGEANTAHARKLVNEYFLDTQKGAADKVSSLDNPRRKGRPSHSPSLHPSTLPRERSANSSPDSHHGNQESSHSQRSLGGHRRKRESSNDQHPDSCQRKQKPSGSRRSPPPVSNYRKQKSSNDLDSPSLDSHRRKQKSSHDQHSPPPVSNYRKQKSSNDLHSPSPYGHHRKQRSFDDQRSPSPYGYHRKQRFYDRHSPSPYGYHRKQRFSDDQHSPSPHSHHRIQRSPSHPHHAFREISYSPPHQRKGITFPFHSGIPSTSTGLPQLGQTRIYFPYSTLGWVIHMGHSHWPPHLVSPLLESYASYLRQRYQAHIPTFFTLDWPPAPTRRVFNLAMTQEKIVRYSRGEMNEELVRLMLLGDVSGILHRKREVKLEEICKLDSAPHKIILIEGAPGAGKSTLAWHICQKWGLGHLLQEFDIVIYIQLRDPATQAASSLADILPARSKDMANEVASEIMARNGCQTLLVIDSWDEYPPGLHGDSLFRTLICNRQNLNMDFSTIIITSRPIATGHLQQVVSSRIEIVGFTPHERTRYFTEVLGDDSRAVKTLQEHLRERPVIEASCYLPLNAAIIAHIFLSQGHTFPTTLHGVFTSLVICCIIRHMKKQAGGRIPQQIPRVTSLDDLPHEIKEQFRNICALAYHGVMENKATFSDEDLQKSNLPVNLSTLSLIQATESITCFEKSMLYNFLHLSVQELLAAFCISKMPSSEQVKIFKQLFAQPRFAAVFQFYAAFTKLQTEGVREIVADIVRSRDKHQRLSLLHCLYEAQDPSLCKFVVSQMNGLLNLHGTTLSPVDCLAVGYFLSEVCLTTSGVFKVNLQNCSLDDYKVRLLVKGFSQSHRARDMQRAADTGVSGSLDMNLRVNNIHYEGAHSVAELLGLPIVISKLQNATLETLDLSDNPILNSGVSHVAEALRHNHTLKDLNICNCGVTDEGMKSLASALKLNTSLKILDLSGNKITDTGLKTLGESLQHNRGLERLKLIGFQKVTVEGIKRFVLSLQHNNHLRKLYVNETGGGAMSVRTAIVNQTRRRKNLPVLIVSD